MIASIINTGDLCSKEEKSIVKVFAHNNNQ